jgi:hypothetical protein
MERPASPAIRLRGVALTAQVIAHEGELTVLGHALPRDSKQARAEMGVVPQLDNLDVSLAVVKRIENESENESGMTGAAAAAYASTVSQPGATTDLILAAARAVVAA